MRERWITRLTHATLTGCALVLWLGGCMPTPPPPPNFAITVTTKPIDPNTGSFEINISGTGFSPGGTVSVSYVNVPNRSGSIPGGSASPIVHGDGTVLYQEAWNCTSNNPDDATTKVLVNMIDNTTGNFTSENISGAPWVCPSAAQTPRRKP